MTDPIAASKDGPLPGAHRGLVLEPYNGDGSKAGTRDRRANTQQGYYIMDG